VPAHLLADLKTAAAAALAAGPATSVEWNLSNSVEPVSNRLSLDFEQAMRFILEEIGYLDEACFSVTVAAWTPHVDVYGHDARNCHWYVKIGLDGGDCLHVASFHPAERPVRAAGVRVRV
jgi:hypothetical protein